MHDLVSFVEERLAADVDAPRGRNSDSSDRSLARLEDLPSAATFIHAQLLPCGQPKHWPKTSKVRSILLQTPRLGRQHSVQIALAQRIDL